MYKRQAYESLLEFKNTLTLLGICENIHVFATASLRNIVNTEEAVAKITAETGFHIDVITGEEETLQMCIRDRPRFAAVEEQHKKRAETGGLHLSFGRLCQRRR